MKNDVEKESRKTKKLLTPITSSRLKGVANLCHILPLSSVSMVICYHGDIIWFKNKMVFVKIEDLSLQKRKTIRITFRSVKDFLSEKSLFESSFEPLFEHSAKTQAMRNTVHLTHHLKVPFTTPRVQPPRKTLNGY